MRHAYVALCLAAGLVLSGCGYNELQTQDEAIKAAWAEVVNQYERRADLTPGLVSTVKGFAAHEEKVLVGVAEARARAGTIQVTPEMLGDPEALARFQAAQAELTGALARLIAIGEGYTELKSDAHFRDLLAQLEGTENRIAVARNRYIAAVEAYNGTVRKFPTNVTARMFGHDLKATFAVENEAEIAKRPAVEF
jgi:LemA protein